MEITAATLDDLPQIVEIERASFPTPWSVESLRRELMRTERQQGDYTAIYLAAREGEQLVGYVGLWLCWGEAHILTLAVAPQWRRQGIAQALMHAALTEAARQGCHYATLEYRVSNTAAAALYEKFGFRVVGRRRRYYRDTGEDAIVVELDDLQSVEVQTDLAELQAEWERKHG